MTASRGRFAAPRLGQPLHVPATQPRSRGHAQAAADPQRSVDNSALDRAARYGIATRGLLYLVLGGLTAWLGVSASSGAPGTGHSASQSGALHTLASGPAGRYVLVAVAVGFAAYAFFQVVDTVFHARKEPTPAKLWAHRVIAGWGVVLYALLCAYALNLALSARPGQGGSGGSASGSGGSGQQYTELTARLLRHGGLGAAVVAAVGAVLVGSGIGLLRRAFTLNFRDRLDRSQMAPYEWRLAMWLGSIGCFARAITIGVVGGYVVEAAVTYDPSDAAGLDGTLRRVAASGYGAYLLVSLGVGLMCFAGYVWFEARYRKV